jgi:hypothetical protein
MKRKSQSLDLIDLFERIEALTRKGKPAGGGLIALAQACADGGVSVDMRAVRALPVARELGQITTWFGGMWKPSPPPAAASALYFGIVEFDDGRHDFRAAALPGKGPDTEQWRWQRSVSPKEEYAGSCVLAALAAKDGPLRHPEARHVVCLGYVALVAAHLCRTFRRALAPRAPWVAAGYDEGDFVVLGKLKPSGAFEPPKPPPEAKPVALPRTGQLFELKDTRAAGSAWLLNCPDGRGGRDLPNDYTQRGRRVAREPLTTTPYLKGKALDVAYTISSVLVMRAHVAALVEKAERGAIQRLPLTIAGTRETFEVVNVLRRVPSSRLLAWTKAHRRPPSEAPLGKFKIARTGSYDDIIVVTRDLAEVLAHARVTGTALIPLEKSRLV